MNTRQLLDYLDKGRDFFMKSDYSRAKEFFEVVITNDPVNSEALFCLGLIFEKKRDYSKAKNYFEQVLSNDPWHDGAKRELNNIEVIQQQLEKGDVSNSTQADFRVAYWGESKELVMLKEGEENRCGDPNQYTFEGKLGNLDCQIGYFFDNDMLRTGIYNIVAPQQFDFGYISTYFKLLEMLTKKYGVPLPEKSTTGIWTDDILNLQEDVSKWGLALRLGIVTFCANWDLDRTNITLLLWMNNGTPNLAIKYNRKELSDQLEESFETDMLNDL